MGNDKPQDAKSILIENLLVYLPLYTLAHCILYFEPQRSLFRPFKLNPRYPAHTLGLRELLRSLRGVAICTALEVMVNKLHVEKGGARADHAKQQAALVGASLTE